MCTMITTGADVIHRSRCRSFGIKIDAIPGRINEILVQGDAGRRLLWPVLGAVRQGSRLHADRGPGVSEQAFGRLGRGVEEEICPGRNGAATNVQRRKRRPDYAASRLVTAGGATTNSKDLDHGDYCKSSRRGPPDHRMAGAASSIRPTKGHRTMYLVFALMGGFDRGTLSIGMRSDLMHPGCSSSTTLTPSTCSRPPHGLIMIFFMVIGDLIGASATDGAAHDRGADMAFPRMNNTSSGCCRPRRAADHLAVRRGRARAPASPRAGRSMRRCRHGHPARRRLRILSLTLPGASSILAAINFITTIFNMRAPGMTLHRCRCSCGRNW